MATKSVSKNMSLLIEYGFNSFIYNFANKYIKIYKYLDSSNVPKRLFAFKLIYSNTL